MKRILVLAVLVLGVAQLIAPVSVQARSGSGSVDTIKVSKCYCDALAGEMLIKASSSNTSAHLYAYTPSGAYLGEVQNGGGSRYGGTVMGYQPVDPQYVTIISSARGSVTVPTTPFQP